MAQARIFEPGIVAISVYVPKRGVGNEEIITRFGFDREFLSQKLGIENRHIAEATEAVSDMAVAAGEKVFASGEVKRDEIELLILCTQTPDFCLPATANLVQDRLRLPVSVAAFDINQGCSGYIYGLAAVRGMMLADGLKCALLITAEAYSKVLDPNDGTTVPLFGDGAAATLLKFGGCGRIGKFQFGSDGGGADHLIVRGGGSRNPTLARSGDGALRMNGRAIFEFAMKRVPENVRVCLEVNGLSLQDIDLFVFHQASRYMVQSLAEALRLPPEKAPFCLRETGNTVSSTMPMALHALGGASALGGKRVMLAGFGVGLSWGSTVITFSGDD